MCNKFLSLFKVAPDAVRKRPSQPFADWLSGNFATHKLTYDEAEYIASILLCHTEQSVVNIFKYSDILGKNIYSDIFLYECHRLPKGSKMVFRGGRRQICLLIYENIFFRSRLSHYNRIQLDKV